jgi:hypothetical protein
MNRFLNGFMSQLFSATAPLQNSSGSVLLPCLIIAVFISIGFMTVLSRTERQADSGANLRAQLDASFLQKTLTMVLSDRAACGSNLIPGAFGADLNTLNAKSASGQLNVRMPNTSGPMANYILSVGSKWRTLTISEVKFSMPAKLSLPDTSYISSLRIQAHAINSTRTTTITIPFYINTDAAGVISDCFATQLLPTQGTKPALAVEDALCAQQHGAGYGYIASEHICYKSTQPTASNLIASVVWPANTVNQ